MNPLLALIPQLIPQLARLLGGEHSGGFQEQAVKAIEDRTGVKDLGAAEAKINTDIAVKEQLQKDLEEIALEELKERNRASEEAGRIDLEIYRMEADERDRKRARALSSTSAIARTVSTRVRCKCSWRTNTTHLRLGCPHPRFIARPDNRLSSPAV